MAARRTAPTRSRASAQRVGVRATDRDRRLLAVVGEQYAVTLTQLAVLMGCRVRGARRLRDRWRGAGWVESGPVLADRPVLLWPTRRGLEVAGSDLRAWSPTPGMAAHVVAVTDVRLAIQAEHPEAVWTGERQLAATVSAAGVHRPDAVVESDGEVVAVEVELSRKSRERTRAIIVGLVATYGQVVYYCAPPAYRLIATLAREVGTDRVHIRPLPDLRERL